MKQLTLCLCAISALFLCSCKGDANEPEGKQQVVFKVSAFEQTTDPMNSPRRAPQATILDDEGGVALTDLYVFDGSTQVAHQVYADDNDAFGTVTLDLTHGNHNLSFELVIHKCSGQDGQNTEQALCSASVDCRD